MLGDVAGDVLAAVTRADGTPYGTGLRTVVFQSQNHLEALPSFQEMRTEERGQARLVSKPLSEAA